jgi:uncharacterized cupin superfamily protein
MEIHPGVFLSSAQTHDWEADPEVGGEMHILCHADGIEAGMSRFADASEPIVWTLPARETLFVLEGRARIEVKDGPTLELEPGDLASLPEGAETTWHLTCPFREFWIVNR